MTIPNEILEAVKAHYLLNSGDHVKRAAVTFGELSQVYTLGHDAANLKNGRGVDLIFCFDSASTLYQDETEVEKKEIEVVIKCGYKTPKGYFSTKMLPVVIANRQDLTADEVVKMWQFRTDAKINNFDPFYAENEAKRRNASAWNYIAQHFITASYCRK